MGNILRALPQAATHLMLISQVIAPLKKVTPSYSIFFISNSTGQLPTKKSALWLRGEKLDLEVTSKYVNLVCLSALRD